METAENAKIGTRAVLGNSKKVSVAGPCRPEGGWKNLRSERWGNGRICRALKAMLRPFWTGELELLVFSNSNSSIGSVQFSHSVVSDSLWPHGLQHTRPPCPSPTPRVYWNSCPSSRWCHQTISSSVIPFSSHLQSFPASGSFPMSQFFESGGQSIDISVSASVLPVNIQDWFPLGWTGWISLQSKGLSRNFSNTTVQKHQFFGVQLSLVQLSHSYMTTGKTIVWTRRTL